MVKGRRGANCKEEPTRAMGSGADSILFLGNHTHA